MTNEFYKAGLSEALKKIIEANNNLFDGAVSIALHGELKEWSDSVPVGETHLFEYSLLKNSEDPNIMMIIELMDELENVYAKICNLNFLDLDET